MSEINLELLKQKFQNPLPGLSSQLKMAPQNRAEQLLQHAEKMLLARQSAVMILLFHEDRALKTVFIKRSEYNGVHSGQISFPGGQFEFIDRNFENTALRETWEEIGVRKEEIEIIGHLTDIYIPPSNFMVKVIVGYSRQKPRYIIDKREVQSVIEVKLETLSEPSAITSMKTDGSTNSVPCYCVNNIKIWGATAMIISELLDVIENDIEL
jgi:8-oxo-dGTP pyrophosphatase MutT (NUDIX family)